MRCFFLAMGLLASVVAPTTRAVRAQAPVIRDSIAFRYNDDDGPGRLTITTVRAAEGGATAIRVLLEQNGGRYGGSGFAYPIQGRPPLTTVYAFAITSPQGAYFFQGETTSGITLSGQGTYHRVGSPERSYRWSIVLGG